jgi:Family of unknown function (DUF6338)
MVPDTLGAVLAFLGLVAPGVAFELLRERRRPTIEETAFREASRIALTSLVFTLGAGAILLLAYLAGAPFIADPAAWLRNGTAYALDNLGLVSFTMLLQVSLALALAVLADWVFRRSAPGHVVPGSIWFQLFRNRRPDGATPWVHLRLTDETEIWGYADDYTPEQKLDNRELTLVGPGLQYRRKGATGNQELDRWAAICVRGDQITWLKVMYVSNDSSAGSFVTVAPRQVRRRAWRRSRGSPSLAAPGRGGALTRPAERGGGAP